MTSAFRALALASAIVVASCGGGGGDSGTGTGGLSSATPQIAITESNARAVSANALDATQNTAATRGATGLPVGVQVNGGGAPGTLAVITQVVQLARTSAIARGLPTAIAIDETGACPLGGTISVSGRVASNAALGPGDAVSITTNNCIVSAGGSALQLNGQLSISVVSGSISGTLPFHVVIATTATNLSVSANGVTAVANGDARLDWTASTATVQTIASSGTTMSSRETINGSTHTTVLRNYSQQLTINGSIATGTLAATVETDSSRLGNGTTSYSISTPTPVVWNLATRIASAGVVRVVGANNSQLLLTVNPDTTATIQIDANGDGAFERTITTTAAELASLV
jgi:hypothetical protein